MDFAEWLNETARLQKSAFGIDFDELRSDPEALADYFHLNITGAFTEVAEVAELIRWKPWTNKRGIRPNPVHIAMEVVDVMHFLANILVAADAPASLLEYEYRRKIEENEKRQAEGYEQRMHNDSDS